jgi:hypothetical protein
MILTRSSSTTILIHEPLQELPLLLGTLADEHPDQLVPEPHELVSGDVEGLLLLVGLLDFPDFPFEGVPLAPQLLEATSGRPEIGQGERCVSWR